MTHHKLINELFYLKKKYFYDCVWKALWLITFDDEDDDDDAVINYVELRQFIFITEISDLKCFFFDNDKRVKERVI